MANAPKQPNGSVEIGEEEGPAGATHRVTRDFDVNYTLGAVPQPSGAQPRDLADAIGDVVGFKPGVPGTSEVDATTQSGSSPDDGGGPPARPSDASSAASPPSPATSPPSKRRRESLHVGVTSSFGNAIKPSIGPSTPTAVQTSTLPPLPPVTGTLAAMESARDVLTSTGTIGAKSQTEVQPDFVDTQDVDDMLDAPDATPLSELQERARAELNAALHGTAQVGPLSAAKLSEDESSLSEEGLSLVERARWWGSQTFYATPQSDDPWVERKVDRLGFLEDAKAFARVVASADVTPPLAIAVFGSWGSGKSFFMRLVHDHVALLSKKEPTSQAPEAASPKFHENIAQIRFNAWHYSETNLWASLVDHLFSQLATHVQREGETSVLDQLSTSRLLTIESAERLAAQRRTQAVLVSQVGQAKAELEARRAVLRNPRTYLRAVEDAVWSNESLSLEVKDAAESLGVNVLKENIEEVRREVESARSMVGSAAVGLRKLSRSLGSIWAAGAVVACVPAAFLIVWAVTRDFSVDGIWNMRQAIETVLTFLGSLVVPLVGLRAYARPLLKMLKAAGTRVEQQVHAATEKAKSDAVDAEHAAAASVMVAEQELAASASKLVSAVEDFHGAQGAGRLVKFLRARGADGHYAQHLGLVASVRKDFEELSLGMQGRGIKETMPEEERQALIARIDVLTADASPLLQADKDKLRVARASLSDTAKVKPPFNRLVLYIDDLDRCSPEKVVEVLQAVHMLLAFPLFAVFVAVDVRWLSASLTKQYEGMLSNSGRLADGAAPHDYLEKIFQIPYWIQDMDLDAGAGLLEGLLPIARGKRADEPVDPITPVTPQPDATPTKSEAPVRSLEFTTFHRDAIKVLLPFMNSSPRRLLWFVNAFRVMKATSRQRVDGDEQLHDLAILLQLGLASISQPEFQRWLAVLEEAETRTFDMYSAPPNAPHDWPSVIGRRNRLRTNNKFWAAADALAAFASSSQVPDVLPSDLLFYGRRAQRFCFEPASPSQDIDVLIALDQAGVTSGSSLSATPSQPSRH